MKHTNNAENFPDKHPFKVPENYFEKLPNRIMAQTAHKPNAVKGLFGNITPLLRIAVACFIIVLVSIGIYNTSNLKELPSANTLLAQVDNDDMKDYLLATEYLEVSDFIETTASENIETLEYIDIRPEDLEEIDPLLVEDYLM